MTGLTDTRPSPRPLQVCRRTTRTSTASFAGFWQMVGVFNLIQNATDTGQGSLVFFLFDLLHLDGENLTALPLLDRKTQLASLLRGAPNSLRYNDHQIGHGPAFHRLERGLEGIQDLSDQFILSNPPPPHWVARQLQPHGVARQFQPQKSTPQGAPPSLSSTCRLIGQALRRNHGCRSCHRTIPRFRLAR
jgi:hypothetical protein